MKNEYFQWKNVRIVPVLHNRMEFAVEVRKQFLEYRPERVAVEYPPTLKERIIQGVKRLPYLSVVYYQESDGTFVYLIIEPIDGLVEAVRSSLEHGVSVDFIDRDTEGYPFDLTPMPDSYAITRVGHYLFCEAYLKRGAPVYPYFEDELRERAMAYRLQRLSQSAERILFVCGLQHLSGILRNLDSPQTEVIERRTREGVGLAQLHRESSREVLSEMPFLIVKYEEMRGRIPREIPDRLKINAELIRVARESHFKNNKEELSSTQVRILFKFARNYALLTGALVPNFYQLIIASRGVADDNFAYEVWDKGSDYPWQMDEPGLPVLRLTGEDLFLDQRRIRFHRTLKRFRRRLVPVPIKKKVKERIPGEWKREFDTHYICSYPPEDVVVEGFGEYLKKKALEIKAEENIRIVPFVSSMMDGLDIRQTIREWHQGKIYVREGMPLRGKVGSVVIIFDPDIPRKGEEERFPWKVTWLGEHDQESDMAFYSTPAGELIVGPGISRCQYGGFMLTYPPLRVYDIWKDPYFNIARNKPERLLMAAIDYSLEKHVVYVAPEPPSGWCQSMAAKMGKKIIYLPIGMFSPVTLRKMRQFHVLNGHHVRRYARYFI